MASLRMPDGLAEADIPDEVLDQVLDALEERPQLLGFVRKLMVRTRMSSKNPHGSVFSG